MVLIRLSPHVRPKVTARNPNIPLSEMSCPASEDASSSAKRNRSLVDPQLSAPDLKRSAAQHLLAQLHSDTRRCKHWTKGAIWKTLLASWRGGRHCKCDFWTGNAIRMNLKKRYIRKNISAFEIKRRFSKFRKIILL